MPTLPDSLQLRIDPARLTERQIELIRVLHEQDQAHLFAGWAAAGTQDDRKLAFLDQALQFHDSYPGGIDGYITKARDLLANGEDGGETTQNQHLEKPEVADLSTHDANYLRLEQRGAMHAASVAFVLVAGGLGERLGHDGIKMEIPVEITTNTSYMQLYCEMIKALEDRANQEHSGERITVPFFIMTSGGTRSQTANFLEANGFFGLSQSQVHIFEQHLVPSITDREAHLALEDPYTLSLKPNGHGDVHTLLHEHGFARAIREMGKTHLIFIQDTNAQIVDLILPALGVSLDRDYDFNFVCVPRIPREPLGAIIRLREGSRSRTLAVEYNQLDEFLRRFEGVGDEAEANGCSAYPGSINLLVVKLDPYVKVLEQTGGTVAEFINPKYADDDRTRFAKPTRMETLMQDVAGLYPESARIGTTVFERGWALAALKNNLNTAIEKAEAREPTYSAAEAESRFYGNNRTRARAAGVRCEDSKRITYHGVPFLQGARVVLSRSFSLTLTDAAPKLRKVELGRDSTLVINGANVFLEDVQLRNSSSLILHVCSGARLRVKGLALSTRGVTFRPLTRDELALARTTSILKMRGYMTETDQPLVIRVEEPGDYAVGPDGMCRRVGDGPVVSAALKD